MRNLLVPAAFACGLAFGVGLVLSGMTDPGKVKGFLDIAGAWDPSLAFVMGGAVLVGLAAFSLAHRRTASILGGAMDLPRIDSIDRRLIAGSAVFGIGWGLAGFCPGPAIVAAAAGVVEALVLGIAMIAGMVIYELIERARARAIARPDG